jgi:hypothetical protein
MSQRDKLAAITYSMIRATIAQYGEMDIYTLCEYLSLDSAGCYMLVYEKLRALVEAEILKTDWSGKQYSLRLAPVKTGEE